MIDINSNSFILFGLIIASFRLYLELIGFDFLKLPLTSNLAKYYGDQRINRFHRMGLIFCVGYIILFAPNIIFS